jgi:hypothetical protein
MSGPADSGHNNPPATTLPELIPKSTILSLIAADIAPLRTRADELTGSCKRFIEAHPTIDDDDADALATRILSLVQRLKTQSSEARDTFKRPILDAGNLVGSDKNGPYFAVAVSVESVSQAITRASLNYKLAKNARIEAAAKAEAKALADEAALAEKMAARGSSTVNYADAATSAKAADDAQKVVDARPADRTRVAGGDGYGVSSLRYKRVATVVDASIVPRNLCTPSQSLIDAAKGKPGTPFPVTPGVSYEDVPDLTVRR